MFMTSVFLQAKDEKKLGVCIVTIRPAGNVPASLGEALTPFVGLELTKSDKIRVIERSQIENVLKQQMLSASGYCDEPECQVKLGKLLNAQKIISGDIAKLGEKFILTVRVVDVETGATEGTQKESCKGGEECLEDAAMVVSKRLKLYLEESKAEITKMVLILAGSFWMGSDEQEAKEAWELCKKYYSACPWEPFEAEMPKRKVYLDAFSIDEYEVTNAQYKQCVNSGNCKKPYDATWYDNASYANHPVVYVDWNQADAYCKWAAKRLPTEAEWEKAARGENGNIWPFGNKYVEKCNNWNYEGELASMMAPMEKKNGNINRGTAPVGSFTECVSYYAVSDMTGNAGEWISDWYDAAYYKNSPEKNPKGPGNGQYKVQRGGSWGGYRPDSFRGAYRDKNYPAFRTKDIGFRCAQ